MRPSATLQSNRAKNLFQCIFRLFFTVFMNSGNGRLRFSPNSCPFHSYSRYRSFYALLPTIRYLRSFLASPTRFRGVTSFGFFDTFIDLVFSSHTLFNTYARELENRWSVNFHKSCSTWLPIVSRFERQSWPYVQSQG